MVIATVDANRLRGNAVVVQEIGEAVNAIRQLADRGAHHALAVILQLAHVAVDAGQAVLAGDFEQPVGAAPVGHHLRQQVALAFVRRAHVGQNKAQQALIQLPAARQQHRRNANAFLINFARERHRPRAHAADVGVVRAIGDVESRAAFAVQKHSGDGGDIGQMRAALKRIVEDRDIARSERECVDGVAHGEGHRAQMHRHVVAHRDGLATGIVDGARVIAALLDVGGKCGLAEHRAHFLGDGNEDVAE